MRVLGLDLGSITLGISISDATNTIAGTYKTLRFPKDEYDIPLNELKSIIEENQITKIVLGLPKNMNNTIGERARITLDFKKQLENKYQIEVITEDERLTSVIGNNLLIKADLSRKKRKKVIDGIAAVIILQSSLDRINKERND